MIDHASFVCTRCFCSMNSPLILFMEDGWEPFPGARLDGTIDSDVYFTGEPDANTPGVSGTLYMYNNSI
jgi:hypothetical protein